MKSKKYYGRDPIKKLMNDPEKREKLFKFLFFLNIWVWFMIFLGAVIFIIIMVRHFL
ncbi:conserved hypothetical protein [Methanocaldococcus vulcanius M7]|uniref:Uncharacterized protein n=1 Tax=Methanocaldococcus vulcanius (strain ATCC 700851 / DSM 12094 / M7) TaxID=579137 RepID=C9RGM6_METVM|nr:hypothetical protein [Methanocaldococcus vulcanius]ACX72728.1 conserved hypothetical protein [Methanocaldococcus vulcanius M7]